MQKLETEDKQLRSGEKGVPIEGCLGRGNVVKTTIFQNDLSSIILNGCEGDKIAFVTDRENDVAITKT